MLGAMNFARSLRALLVLAICVHLLLDMAMPWVPGAFRMSAEESVAAALVRPVIGQHLKPPLQWKPPPVSLDIPHRRVLIRPNASQMVEAPPTILVPTRRNTSDPPLQSRAEDH